MNQTENNPSNSSAPQGGDVEQIRKVYARDVKPGDAVHTVFKTTAKERHTSRAGKTFLAFTLFDRTGTVDGRVFDAVDAAEKAFVNDDYLLVKGKVIVFHGKPQLVVDSLERLDPEPIDGKEFAAPPAPTEPAPRHEQPKHGGANKQLRQRVLALLDDPEIASGLAALVRHLEAYIDERVSGKPTTHHERPRHEEREPRKPRVMRATVEHKADAKVEPKRDPSLPKELAFKPFSALAPTGEEPAAATPAKES